MGYATPSQVAYNMLGAAIARYEHHLERVGQAEKCDWYTEESREVDSQTTRRLLSEIERLKMRAEPAIRLEEDRARDILRWCID